MTLYNRCAASFPNGFVVNFNSTATPQSEAVSRCTPDRVNIDPDYVNPFADVDVNDFLSGTLLFSLYTRAVATGASVKIFRAKLAPGRL